MLVEAAWAAVRLPGPLRAFHKRIASRRGKHIAAVATARKLAMIKDTDYIWARPALLARKFRSVALRAGLPTSHARRGTAFDYNIRGQARRRTIPRREGGSCLCSSDFPMANEAGKAEGCGKSRRMRRTDYSRTSVCIGLPGAM